MARSALGLGVREIAELAGVSPDTIARLERGDLLKDRTVETIRGALEAAGVEFIPENGGGAGVRLKKRGAAPDHPKPTGPATDVVDAMDQAIAEDRGGRKTSRVASVKETGEELSQEDWKRFEAADKRPKT